MTCLDCNRYQAAGAFCMNCGKKLDKIKCAECGRELTPVQKFCEHCGSMNPLSAPHKYNGNFMASIESAVLRAEGGE